MPAQDGAAGPFHRSLFVPVPRRLSLRQPLIVILYVAARLSWGAWIYIKYRTYVRIPMERFPPFGGRSGSFEFKEHVVTMGLALLPAYWYFLQQPSRGTCPASADGVTFFPGFHSLVLVCSRTRRQTISAEVGIMDRRTLDLDERTSASPARAAAAPASGIDGSEREQVRGLSRFTFGIRNSSSCTRSANVGTGRFSTYHPAIGPAGTF